MSDDQPTATNLTHTSISGMLWMGSTRAIVMVLQLVVLTALARLLTPHDFGVFGAAMVVIGVATVVATMGLEPAVVQKEDLRPSQQQAALSAMVVGALLTAVALVVLAPTVAEWFSIRDMTPVLRVAALLLPLTAVEVFGRSLLFRYLRFSTLARLNLASYAAYALVAISAAIAGWGVWALVAGIAAQSVLAIVFLAFSVALRFGWIRWKSLRDLLGFGLGFMIGESGNQVAASGDNAVVGAWLGSDQLGVYGRAYQLMALPATVLGAVVDSVLFPAMARRQANPEVLKVVYRRGVAAIALAIGPLSAVLAIMSADLVLVVLGSQWSDAVVPFQILAAGMVFRGSHKISESVVRATGAVYRRAWRRWVHAGLIVGGALVGQNWGLAGVAVGILIALILNFGLMAHLVLKIVGMSWSGFFRAHLPAVWLTVLAGSTAFVASRVMGAYDVPALVNLAAVSAVVLGVTVLSASRMPRLLLGSDGIWSLRRVKGVLGSGLRRRSIDRSMDS